MTFYIAKTVALPFERALEKTIAELKKQGFGILTEIDVAKTLKEKLDVSFRRYRILGACNPPFAYEALLAEDKIGLLLPCNVIVQERSDTVSEVAAVDPRATIAALGKPALEELARQVGAKLDAAISHV